MARKQERPPRLYNADRPFVVVDIGDDTPGRGDSHGALGIAKRVAQKTGGKFLYVDNVMVEGLYPEIRDANNNDRNALSAKTRRMIKLFEDNGMPDFYFMRHYDPALRDHLDKHAAGIRIETYNEHLSHALDIRDLVRERGNVVPHHLTPEMLEYEGSRFAEEYAEMPRPFIGVNLAGLHYPAHVLKTAEKLGNLKDAYETATLFICSCHRTSAEAQDQFLAKLRETLGDTGDRFHVINFDYKTQTENYGINGVWNPYIGLLDQADHIIIEGDSDSMISEALSTGKTVHRASNGFDAGTTLPLKNLFAYAAAEPLETVKVQPIDLTAAFADSLIRLHREHVLSPAPEQQTSIWQDLSRFVSETVLRKPSKPYPPRQFKHI